MVSIPARSMTRADSSISSSGSIVSCMTPMRSGGGTDGSSQLRTAGSDGEGRADFGQTRRTQFRDSLDKERSWNHGDVVETKHAILGHSVFSPKGNLRRYVAN